MSEPPLSYDELRQRAPFFSGYGDEELNHILSFSVFLVEVIKSKENVGQVIALDTRGRSPGLLLRYVCDIMYEDNPQEKPEFFFLRVSRVMTGRSDWPEIKPPTPISFSYSVRPGARILLVDDIIDDGGTLFYAEESLIERGAGHVASAVFSSSGFPSFQWCYGGRNEPPIYWPFSGMSDEDKELGVLPGENLGVIAEPNGPARSIRGLYSEQVAEMRKQEKFAEADKLERETLRPIVERDLAGRYRNDLRLLAREAVKRYRYGITQARLESSPLVTSR